MNPLVERLAREAGFEILPTGKPDGSFIVEDSGASMERFAALVAAHCSDLCAVMHNAPLSVAAKAPEAIRAAFPMPKG